MEEVKTRRKAIVIKVGNSNALTLSEEFNHLGVKNGDEVVVTIRDGRIEIEKVEK